MTHTQTTYTNRIALRVGKKRARPAEVGALASVFKYIIYHETGNGWSLVTVSAWKNSVNAAVGGVGLLIGPRTLKTLNSIELIQPRMMAATFNGNPRATIIPCNNPTNVSEETELVTFYDELSSLVRSIPKHNMFFIGGDMNAKIGKNGNNKYSLHNTSNSVMF